MNNVFVYIEIEDKEIADVSLELLTKGRELANTLGVKLEAVVIGNDVKSLAPELAKYGADTVWVAEDEMFAPFRTLPHTAVMVGLIEQEKPQIALFGATPVGRDFAPRVSSALHSGLTADCTELIIGEHKDGFTSLGYTVKSKILYASDYGVPQRRNRLFIVGNKDGIKFEFPEKFDYEVTVDEALDDLPLLTNGEALMVGEYRFPIENVSDYAKLMRIHSDVPTQNIVSRNKEYVVERYKYIKQGENWEAIPDYLMQNYADKKRCHSGIYRRLIGDKPSVVISNYRKSMLIHPHQDRGLSVREAARLQSFPDHFVFDGPISYVQQQIGNAVPPLLAKAVIDRILTYNK